MGRFEMRVCSARNVANVQTFGIPDPYVKVSVIDGVTKKPSIYKTAVRKDDLNPVWNELFKFQVADPDKVQIKLELWNDNVLKDDLLGQYDLSINGLEKGVVKDAWLILQKTQISTTELHVRLLAVDFGQTPAPDAKILTSMENDEFVHHAAVPNPMGSATTTVNCYFSPPNSGSTVYIPAQNYSNNNYYQPPQSNSNMAGVINMPLPPHLMAQQRPPHHHHGFGGPPPPPPHGYGPPQQFGGPPPPPPPQFGGPPPQGYGPWSGRQRPYGGGMQALFLCAAGGGRETPNNRKDLRGGLLPVYSRWKVFGPLELALWVLYTIVYYYYYVLLHLQAPAASACIRTNVLLLLSFVVNDGIQKKTTHPHLFIFISAPFHCMCDSLVKALVEQTLQSLSARSQAVPLQPLPPIPNCTASTATSFSVSTSSAVSSEAHTDDTHHPDTLNINRHSLGGAYTYASQSLLRVGAVDSAEKPLRHSNDLRWLRQLLRVADTLWAEQQDDEARRWLMQNGDDVRRRIRELEADRGKVVYEVQHEPRPVYGVAVPSAMTFSDYYAQPHGSVAVRRAPEPDRDEELGRMSWRRGSGPTAVEVRPVYPNRAIHASDIVRYPNVEITNTLGLDAKEHHMRTAHRHSCIRCGTAEPCMFRYIGDVEDEFHFPERRAGHLGAVSFESDPKAAQLVADCMAQLRYAGKEPTQLEKGLHFREVLTDAVSDAVSSTHRLRQEGIYTNVPSDTAAIYTTAYRRAHLEPAVRLPPVDRGDGHEGHFYLTNIKRHAASPPSGVLRRIHAAFSFVRCVHCPSYLLLPPSVPLSWSWPWRLHVLYHAPTNREQTSLCSHVVVVFFK
eukprot:gene3649-2584_t